MTVFSPNPAIASYIDLVAGICFWRIENYEQHATTQLVTSIFN